MARCLLGLGIAAETFVGQDGPLSWYCDSACGTGELRAAITGSSGGASSGGGQVVYAARPRWRVTAM